MNKKHKSKRQHRQTRNQQARPYDQRRGDAITVAWVISAIACGLAGVISGIGIFLTRDAQPGGQPTLWETLTPLMLFIAATTGLIVCCLTPLVYIFRRAPPPIAITVLTLAVALFPFIALILMA
jgi:heme/copper-type cytochrome/quinol oxidase subunit 2